MTINLQVPQKFNIKPTITVFGVGGAGGNAVNNMISSGIEGVRFVVANTDAQSLDNSLAENKIQLGETITQGLGAGSYPEVGKAAAEETSDLIIDALADSNMVFITAGMGGGTGTGAAPVVARLAREQGVLTVAVVTKPFHFEGSHRMRVAEFGLQELQKYVDTLVVIPNQNLFRVADKNTTFSDAFRMADDVLNSGIRGITDLMVMPGLINLDFADIRSVMSEMGKAMMGSGEASGENRAIESAEAAISNPLLDNMSMKGAQGVLINITGGPDMTLFEVDEAANRIKEEVDQDANIIFGSTFDQNLEGKVRVSIVATGIDTVADSGNVTSLFGQDGNEAVAEEEEEITEIQDELDDEEEAAFLAPEPVEANVEEEEEESKPFVATNKVVPSKSAKQKGVGLFGMRFGSSEKAETPKQQPKIDTSSEADYYEEEEEEDGFDEPSVSSRESVEKQDIKDSEDKAEDFLDIPAFLRRKSN